jgi:mannose-6-phosphate isomerase-like protein (cupin superfamily)
MNKIAESAAVRTAAVVAPVAVVQTAQVDHMTQSQMLEKAGEFELAAASSGAAGTKLADYPNHFTMITLRKKSGSAEIHQQFADIFFVVRGDATLVNGGEMVDAKTETAGEIRGTSVKGGVQTLLRAGDYVHIPAGVPHQLVLPEHGDFVYFVLKVREQ